MLIFKKIIFFAFLLILQMTFFPKIFQTGISPDLLFIGLVVLCLLTNPQENLIWAMIFGVVIDSIMPFPFWLHVFFFLLTPITLYYLKNTIFTNRLLLGSFYLISSNIIYYLIYFFIINSPIQRYNVIFFLKQFLFPIIFYNLFMFLILYFVSRLLFNSRIILQKNET